MGTRYRCNWSLLVKSALPLVFAMSLTAPAMAQAPQDDNVRVLVVTAHPDDDAAFAGSVYRITHHIGGVVDLALVTDGSGGFRYANLAEPIYGIQLTDEKIARDHLPAIRKRELMAGGAIVGIRNYFFLDQYDHQYTLDADTVLGFVWDSTTVRQRLTDIMQRGSYDFVIGMLPFPQTHGHHKSATILALHAAQSLPSDSRPIVLGGFPCEFNNESLSFEGLASFPMTRVSGGRALGSFDRTQKFGDNERLDFRIIVNWVIAEHKSQGTMQLLMNRGERECYWYFDVNGAERQDRVVQLFESLRLQEP